MERNWNKITVNDIFSWLYRYKSLFSVGFFIPIKNTSSLQSKSKLPVPLSDWEGGMQEGEEEYPDGTLHSVLNTQFQVYWKRISSAPHLQELL